MRTEITVTIITDLMDLITTDLVSVPEEMAMETGDTGSSICSISVYSTFKLEWNMVMLYR